MGIKTIYIARHGYRMNWLPPPHPPNPTGIDSDPPLAPQGVEQAKELANHIKSWSESEQPQFILSSPFYRCVETGEPISEAVNIPIVLERGVGEWYKVGRGVIPEPADYDRLQKFFKNLSNSNEWDRDNTIGVIPSLNGETEEDIFERCKKFWLNFFKVFESKYPKIERILIISHAATKISLGMTLMGFKNVLEYIDDDKTLLRAGACSLDKYALNEENKKWEIKINGDCSFLSKGEQMNWNFHNGFEAGSDEDIKARQLEFENEKREIENAKSKAEEFEDFYVTVDLPQIGRTNEKIKPSSTFQITNINEDNPLIKLSNPYQEEGEISLLNEQLYKFKWEKLVGTDLIIDENGEIIGKVKDHLNWDSNTKFIEKRKEIKYERSKDNTDSTSFFQMIKSKVNAETVDLDNEMEVDQED